MFKRWFLVSFISIYWQYVAGRNLPKPDISDLNLNFHPYQPAFPQQYQLVYELPRVTYLDQQKGLLRPFPGGGVPVLIDNKLCPDQFVGIMANRVYQQFYYVCKPDSEIIAKCQNLQIFATTKQCVQHPPTEYILTCTEEGSFPLSDFHLYYKCEKDLKPKIYSCPNLTVFSPALKKCININNCTRTVISSCSSYMTDYCADKFPPCFENGTFRSPSDCSLYYKCESKNDSIYEQTRLRCPQGKFYDLHKKDCLPAKEVTCNSIQLTEMVYSMPNSLPIHLVAHPSEFDLNAMGSYQYPTEPTGELNENFSTSKSAKDNDIDEATILNDDFPEKNLFNRVIKDRKILSDLIDLDHTEEGSGLESETLRATVTVKSSHEKIMARSENFNSVLERMKVNNQKTTEVGEYATTNNVNGETTIAPDKVTEELEKANTEILPIPTEMYTKTSITQEEKVEEVTTEKISDYEPLTKNFFLLPTISNTHNNNISNADTTISPTATTVLGNTNSLSSTTRYQTYTVIPTTTTHLNTTQITLTSNNFETTQHPNEKTSDLGSDNAFSYVLYSNTNLLTTETSQSPNTTTTEEATQQTDIGSSQDVVTLPSLNVSTEGLIYKAANDKHAMQLDKKPENETTETYRQTEQMEEAEPKDVYRSTTILNTTKQPGKTTLSITTSKQEEIMLVDNPSKNGIGKGESKHESTSAETNQTTINSMPSFPHPTSISLTSTQTPILSSISTIRIPLIKNVTTDNNKSNNDAVTASPRNQTNNLHIPRLEVKVQSPMEVFFSICPPTCNKTHEHSNSNNDDMHAALVKWFPNESNQTLLLLKN